MKTKLIYTLLLALSLFLLNIEAQPLNEKKLESATENCYSSLMHDNLGVVESAIFVSIQFKNKYPKENSNQFIEALDELAKNSENPIISYKAQLARMYFKNNELFSNIEVISIKDEQKVFEKIAEKLNSIILATEI